MPTILAVDGSPGVTDLLKAILEPGGFEVTVSSSGSDAIKKYKAKEYDVVLSNVPMKPIDGFMLLEELRGYDPDAMVILMSGHATKEMAIK